MGDFFTLLTTEIEQGLDGELFGDGQSYTKDCAFVEDIQTPPTPPY